VVSVSGVFVSEHVEHEAVGCDDGVSVPEVVVGHEAALQWIGLESYEAMGGDETTFQFDCSKGDGSEMVKYRIYYEDDSYDLIRCPECDSEETSLAGGDDFGAMICAQ
jgi:hypothetical protein